MKSKSGRISLLAFSVSAVVLSGCANYTKLNDQERLEQVSGVDKHSSYPAVRRTSFEQVNLVELIDPNSEAKERFKTAWQATPRNAKDELETDHGKGRQLDLVLSWFRSKHNTMSDAEKALTRNSVQERIMSVSTSRCNVFHTYLRREQSDVNFQLGTGATIAGVLGALLPGVNASRNLAGAAGILSGTNAEFNQAYYGNLAAQVISQGIESKRAQVQKRILEEGQKKSIYEYSLEAAIRDAVYFDGLCSTVVGLEQAMDSIRMITNPGLENAISTMVSIRAANELSHKSWDELAKDDTLEKLLKRSKSTISPLAASTNGSAVYGATGSIMGTIVVAEELRYSQKKTLEAAVKKYTEVYNKLKAEHEQIAKFSEIPTVDKAKAAMDTQLQSVFSGMLFESEKNASQADVSKSCLDKIQQVSLDITTANATILAAKNEDQRVSAQIAATKKQAIAQALAANIRLMQKLIEADFKVVANKWNEWMSDDKTSKTALQVKVIKNAAGKEELDVQNAALPVFALVKSDERNCASF